MFSFLAPGMICSCTVVIADLVAEVTATVGPATTAERGQGHGAITGIQGQVQLVPEVDRDRSTTSPGAMSDVTQMQKMLNLHIWGEAFVAAQGYE